MVGGRCRRRYSVPYREVSATQHQMGHPGRWRWIVEHLADAQGFIAQVGDVMCCAHLERRRVRIAWVHGGAGRGRAGGISLARYSGIGGGVDAGCPSPQETNTSIATARETTATATRKRMSLLIATGSSPSGRRYARCHIPAPRYSQGCATRKAEPVSVYQADSTRRPRPPWVPAPRFHGDKLRGKDDSLRT